MILCIGTTPAAQRVMFFPKLELDAVNRSRRTLDGAAGKSVNVAKVLKALGERPVATGFLGGNRGEEIRRALEQREIEMEFVQVRSNTRQCITVIDQTAGNQTELVEESLPVEAEDYSNLIQLIGRRIKAARAAVMSGTITPDGPDDFYLRCTELAHEAGSLPVVDAKGEALLKALQAKPGLVKPNRSELAQTVGAELHDPADLIKAMRQLCERGAERVVVTSGAQPTFAFDGQSVWQVQAPRIQAVNPIGSGDAFTAGLVWRLLRGDDLGEACRWASASGAANALSPMPGELTLRDVERLAGEAQVRRI